MSNTAINPSLGMRVTLAAIGTRFAEVRQISTDDFHAIWSRKSFCQEALNNSTAEANSQPDLLVFDVRNKYERDISFIKDSIWIDANFSNQIKLEIVKSKIDEKVNGIAGCDTECSNKELMIVAYCSIGYRSCDLIKRVLEADMPSIFPSWLKIKLFNLEGSLFKWANEGKPMIDSSNFPTVYAHPYNSVWGKLLTEKFRKLPN